MTLGTQSDHFAEGDVSSNAAASLFETPDITRVAAHDADEFGEAMRDWNVDLRQLHSGSFEAAIMVLPLGPALICSGRYNQALLQHVGPPDDCLNINRPGRGSDPISVAGHEVEPGEVFISGSGAECESMSRGVLFPTALSVKVSYLESQAYWLDGAHVVPPRTVRLHSPGVEWANSFLDAMEWIVAAVAQYPAAVSRSDVCGSMLDTLLARVNTVVAVKAPLSDEREMRSARRLAVERAREYIHANLTDPIRLSDLCKYARTQARSLEYGFHEVLGVSPIAYIRATRLHRVRRLLRSTAVRTRSISEIALDCGFWHLSQFAVDYKRLFTESPSVTYRRTHAQLPRVERRNVSATLPSHISKNVRPTTGVAVPC
jgi:AraC family ethanolamine operon transcriptional activator